MSDVYATRRGFCRATGAAAVVGLPSVELVAPPAPAVEWTATAAGEANLHVVGDIAFLAGRNLRALDPVDGRERWRVEGERRVRPEAVGGDAVFADRDGDLWAFDGRAFALSDPDSRRRSPGSPRQPWPAAASRARSLPRATGGSGRTPSSAKSGGRVAGSGGRVPDTVAYQSKLSSQPIFTFTQLLAERNAC